MQKIAFTNERIDKAGDTDRDALVVAEQQWGSREHILGLGDAVRRVVFVFFAFRSLGSEFEAVL